MFIHVLKGGDLQTFVLLLLIEVASYVLLTYYVMFVKLFTETIQVTVATDTFLKGHMLAITALDYICNVYTVCIHFCTVYMQLYTIYLFISYAVKM